MRLMLDEDHIQMDKIEQVVAQWQYDNDTPYKTWKQEYKTLFAKIPDTAIDALPRNASESSGLCSTLKQEVNRTKEQGIRKRMFFIKSNLAQVTGVLAITGRSLNEHTYQ
tara:strand:+ start:349 stop:678 length:330 start_codon:yes stop_codon:yes gene_type:complete